MDWPRVVPQRAHAVLFTFLLLGCQREAPDTSAAEIFPEPTPVEKTGCTGETLHDQFIVQWKSGRFSVEHGINRKQFIHDFIEPQLSAIQHVEYDRTIHMDARVVASVVPTNPPVSWGQEKINAVDAWNAGLKGQNIIVAVIDSGVDIQHQQLKDNIAINLVEANGLVGIDDDLNGYIDDVGGWDFVSGSPLKGDNQYHGTHVAGIIAADPSQGPIQGVAPKAKILPLAFLDSTGSGSTGGAIQAIQYARDRGARLINASWGGPVCSVALEKIITELGTKDILFVAAAGNEGNNLDFDPEYPASYGELNLPSLVVVGASTELDLQAAFSNYSRKSVALMAPGDGIYSTVPKNLTRVLSGTSMATPFVVGALAALMSHPSAPTAARAKEVLLRNVKPGRFNSQTSGRLDLGPAVRELNQQPTP